jgi:hypothetical protein
MKKISIGLVMVLMIAGCSSRTAPVSSHTEITHEKDSVHSKTTAKSDSSFYKETLKEKVLPKAEVGITTNKNQLDSLISALRSLPSNTPKEIHYQDLEARAMLTILLDSLGNIQFKCTALEQHYNEKFIEQQRIINNLTSENDVVKEQNSTLKTEIIQEKIPGWQKAWIAIKGFGVGSVAVVLIIVALMLGIPFFRKK